MLKVSDVLLSFFDVPISRNCNFKKRDNCYRGFKMVTEVHHLYFHKIFELRTFRIIFAHKWVGKPADEGGPESGKVVHQEKKQKAETEHWFQTVFTFKVTVSRFWSYVNVQDRISREITSNTKQPDLYKCTLPFTVTAVYGNASYEPISRQMSPVTITFNYYAFSLWLRPA